jgi:PAS domain S-box-containing protein
MTMPKSSPQKSIGTQELLDQLPDLIWFKDKDLRYVKVNQAFAERMGVKSPKDCLGKKPEDFFPNDIATRYQKDDKAIMKNGKVHKREDKFCNQDGTKSYYQKITGPIYDDKGRVAGSFGISRDISDLKNAQMELAQAAEIVKNIQIGLYVYRLENQEDDHSLRLISANPASEKFTGVPAKKVLGKTIDENFPLLREQGVPEVFAEVVRKGEAVDLQRDVYYQDDRVKEGIFRVKAFPMEDDCVGVSFENVTRQKKMEKALKKSEERYRDLVETSNDLIFVDDTEGNFLFVNKVVEELLGYSEDEFLSKNAFELVHPDDHQRVLRDRLPLFEGRKVKNAECRVRTKQGNYVYVSISGSPLFDEEGRVRTFLGLARDVSEQKEAEARLLDSYKHLGLINRRLAILLGLKKTKGKGDSEATFDILVESALSLSNARDCWLYFYSKELERFHLMAYKQSSVSEKEKGQLTAQSFSDDSLGKNLKNKLIKKRRRIQLTRNDLNKKKIPVGSKLGHVLMVPLVVGDQFWGILVIGFNNTEDVTTQELDFYDAFASHASVFLEENLEIDMEKGS